jgi:hypothetical protein
MLRDPRVSTALMLGALSLSGLVASYLGYRGIAAESAVPLQVPYLISGAIVGAGAVGTGLALLVVHIDRCEAAQERQEMAQLQRSVLRALRTVSAQQVSGPVSHPERS